MHALKNNTNDSCNKEVQGSSPSCCFKPLWFSFIHGIHIRELYESPGCMMDTVKLQRLEKRPMKHVSCHCHIFFSKAYD